MKKFFAKLIANFQPRMGLGEKRFLEGEEAAKEAARYNKQLTEENMRDHLNKQAKNGGEVEIPLEGPYDHSPEGHEPKED